jgi:putative zinc finger protein
MTDQFAMYDAAYLLGALTPQDRADFEVHLEECADCRNAVNQLAGMPGLLSSVSAESMSMALHDPPPVPDTLLPNLLAEVDRARFRRRWVTGLGGLAAAAAVALVLALGLTDSGSPSPTPPSMHVTALRMTPLIPNIPVHAEVALTDKAWGTALQVWCTYTGEAPGHAHERFTYTMVVTDKSGATQQIAAWAAKPGEPVVATGATSVPRSEIASVQVRGPSDTPLLEVTL